MLRRHGCKQRPYAKFLGAVSLESDLGDAALDHLDPNDPLVDVLRRHDCAAQMEAGGPVAIADGGCDRGEIGLGDLLSKIGLISGCQLCWRDPR